MGKLDISKELSDKISKTLLIKKKDIINIDAKPSIKSTYHR